MDELDLKLHSFENFLKEEGIWFKTDFIIKYETYFKTGGKIKIYCTPKTEGEMIKACKFLKLNCISFKIIGFTSNILLFDHVEYSIIISTKNLTGIKKIDGLLEVECGYSLQDFVRVVSVLYNSEGYEGLEGIPGSLGGAIFMNAAAYGTSISDRLVSVKYLDASGQIQIKNKEECDFTYRDSLFRSNEELIILSATFQLKTGDCNEIREKIETFHIARHSYQEFVYPNLGSLISINSDIYLALLKNYRLAKCKYFLLKILFKNPIVKLIKRKKPDNIVFNDLVQKYVGAFPFEPSKKSINILVNRGDNTIADLYSYMINLDGKLGGEVCIENEFVFDPIYKIEKSHEELHWSMKKRLKFNKKLNIKEVI